MQSRPLWVFGVAVAALAAAPALAAKRKRAAPLPVPENPLDLATPTWFTPETPRGASKAKVAKGLRIGAIYPAPQTDKNPQPAEAISLFNSSSEPIRLSGLRLEVSSYRRGKFKHHSMTLASKGVIDSGAELWLAADTRGFSRQFGRLPGVSASGAGGEVASLGDPWTALPDGRAVVRLYQPGLGHIDTVAYNLTSKPWSPTGMALWTGLAVDPTQSSAVTGKRQLIRRDRSTRGDLLPEYDGARDYDSCSWHSGLGSDPVHRCFMAGQSDFNPARHAGVAEVIATSAPDNNFKGLITRFDQAKREILVSIYHFTSGEIADALVRAVGRGLVVRVYAEGSPVGGLPKNSLRMFRRLIRAGVSITILRGDKKNKVLKRFRYDHSKYAIIDREWAVIGSENYGYTGHPVDNRYGNRGWEIQIKHPGFVADLLAVWNWDTSRSNPDVEVGDERLRVPVIAEKPALAAPKSRRRRSKRLGEYLQPVLPAKVKESMHLQLVLSPDNSLAEEGSVIGMIKGAQKELLVLQNSMPTRWGRGRKKVTSPLVEAVVAAARRGVVTRVLLDATFYQLDPLKPDGNDDTVRYLNALAASEDLDLQARVIDLETLGLSKIHAKGVMVDQHKTFVGSQNWSENSFRGNREVGVVVESKAVTDYYRRLFWRDWRYSPESRRPLLSRTRLGKRSVEAGSLVGLIKKRGDRCTVRYRSQVGELSCDQLGARYLSASQTYVQEAGPAVVRGRVRKLHKSKSYWYLNFGEFWRQDFSIQIPVALVEKMVATGIRFDQIAGVAIEARGELSRYNGPSLRIERSEDLKVLTLRKGSPPWP
jgi:phosphatidylserine/phosphatidylglycerophosphate/cardiolipin synthase-like enzyme